MPKNAESYDVIIIGAGPAGYVAAIRCAQLGFDTICIDDWTGKDGKASLGGTFLNAGCIPSLALLESSKCYDTLQNGMDHCGIKVSGVELDVPTMIQHKDSIVKHLSGNIANLFKANGIKSLHGRGRLLEGKRVEVTHHKGHTRPTILSAEHIILATGSSPFEIAAATLNHDDIVDSAMAMNFETVPKHLGIIGAGVIGLEHASVWARLGARVTLLDAQEDFLPFCDGQIAAEALHQYGQQGLDIRLGARVTATKKTSKHVTVQYEDREGQHRLMLDKLIVAVGRKPNTENLFAPEVDLLLDEQGFVHIDEQCMTNLPSVYAIGDLVRGPMLAHKGSEEGIFVAEMIAGKERTLNYDAIPCVVYTDPEIAWVGQNEQAVKASGEPYNVGIFPFSANARAQAIGKTTGLAKIISHRKTDRILGVHLIGHNASELISEGVLAMEFCASTEDLARTIHAHPTLSKALHEAALSIDKRALHIPPDYQNASGR